MQWMDHPFSNITNININSTNTNTGECNIKHSNIHSTYINKTGKFTGKKINKLTQVSK